MTPHMLRTVGHVAFVIALVLAGLWLFDEMQGDTLLDDPLPGAIGFGLLAFTCYSIARKGEDKGSD